MIKRISTFIFLTLLFRATNAQAIFIGGDADINSCYLGGKLINDFSTLSQNSQPFNFKVFPNPTTDILQVALTNNEDPHAVIRISDINGIVIEQLAAQNDMSVNVSNLANGVYLITYISTNQNATEKFTVTR